VSLGELKKQTYCNKDRKVHTANYDAASGKAGVKINIPSVRSLAVELERIRPNQWQG